MAMNPSAAIEITAFNWVPDFARGLVRDIRVRWALEEAGIDYRIRLLDAMAERPQDYFLEQPFGQVPVFVEGDVHMFESGAILLHVGERSDALLPRDEVGRARATCWLIAALNSVEPMIFELVNIDLFNRVQEWARQRRPEAEQKIRDRLKRLSAYQARCEARPAFQRALAAQMADFMEREAA